MGAKIYKRYRFYENEVRAHFLEMIKIYAPENRGVDLLKGVIAWQFYYLQMTIEPPSIVFPNYLSLK